jgi:hypothetical protein
MPATGGVVPAGRSEAMAAAIAGIFAALPGYDRVSELEEGDSETES